MTTETRNQHPLVTRYLKDLDRALRDVPGDKKTEIIEDVKERIADAAAERGDSMTESELRSLLDQVGHPETIAEDARERFGIRRKRGRAMEGIAIAGLLIGGLVFPAIGWILGVVLLWVSDAWSTRDKILGTLVVPGGLAAPLFFGVYAVGASSCIGTECRDAGGASFPDLGIVILALLVLAPIAMAIYLGRKAFRGP